MLLRIPKTCSVHYPFIMWQHSVRVFTSMRAMVHFSINYLNVVLECMLLLYVQCFIREYRYDFSSLCNMPAYYAFMNPYVFTVQDLSPSLMISSIHSVLTAKTRPLYLRRNSQCFLMNRMFCRYALCNIAQIIASFLNCSIQLFNLYIASCLLCKKFAGSILIKVL